MRTATRFAACIFVLFAISVFSQPAPLGPVFQVNTTTTGQQTRPDAGIDSSGAFVVVWESPQDGSGSAVIGQRFDANEVKQGTEFQVNTGTANNQQLPSIAKARNSGDFIVVWQSDEAPTNFNDIHGRYFTAAGAGGADTFITSATTGEQRYPGVATDPAGNFVVSWGDGFYNAVVTRAGVVGGGIYGSWTPISTTATGTALTQTSVARAADGSYVVVWDRSGNTGSGSVISGRKFNAVGSPTTAELLINTATVGTEARPRVAIAPDGKFFVAWDNGSDVIGRLFDSAGNPLTGQFVVNTYLTYPQTKADVAVNQSGDFIVVWNSIGQVDYGGVVAGQQINAAGTKIGPEFVVNVSTYSNTASPSIDMAPNGTFLVTWDALHYLEPSIEVRARRFASLGVRGDFNTDAKADIVLRNYSTGQNALWLMNKTALTGIVDLPALPNANYRFEGTADFNADGKMDVVLRNYQTGSNALWLMNGTALVSIVDLPALPDVAFHFEGTADFNGDAKPDIVLRNYATGQNAIWLMNGTSVGSIVDLPALANLNYRFESSGDFNGDGKADLVLRNYATGQDALWLMNGTAVTSIVDLPALPNVNYRFDGVGDFNGDGKPDIVLRNYSTGQNALWVMNGTSVSSIVDLPALPNLNYEINGPR